MAFADHYPLAAFAAIADACWWRSGEFDYSRNKDVVVTPEQRRLANDLDAKDHLRLEKHKTDVLAVALRAHLAELQSTGALAATGGIAGRKVWAATAWNALVSGQKEDYQTNWLINSLCNAHTRYFVRMDPMRRDADRELGTHVPPTAEQVEKTWKAICEAYDSGNSNHILNGWNVECQDEITGDRCELAFTNWQAQLMRRNAKHDLEPAQDVVNLPLAAVAINMPTGKLLLTDYLRVTGIKEGIDLGNLEYDAASLSSDKGKLQRTQLHAELHNMGFCQTSNTMINVFVSDADGSIAFMPYDKEKMKGWTKIERYISCDVWRITAIDQANAVRIMTAGGNDNAQADLERYLALAEGEPASREGKSVQEINQEHHEYCYSQNVLRLDVAPGVWTLHCGQDFHTRVDRRALGLPRGVRPWAVLQAPQTIQKELSA